VTAAQLSPFDSPYAPASVNAYTQYYGRNFPVIHRDLSAFAAQVPSDQAADVLETSRSTALDIMATGREFLPVGGFSGAMPSPTVPAFERLVRQGRIIRATVITHPRTDAPVMRWVMQHCQKSQFHETDPVTKITSTVYFCQPADARPG
jgi:hypothetical protein